MGLEARGGGEGVGGAERLTYYVLQTKWRGGSIVHERGTGGGSYGVGGVP